MTPSERLEKLLTDQLEHAAGPSEELWAEVDAHLMGMGFELRRARAQPA
jgi:hypothetical protein